METMEQINTSVKFSRVWSMPNKFTFLIRPISKLIYRYGGDFKGWIDPFANANSPAEITNDLNPEMPTKYHLKAEEFLSGLGGGYNGVLFDPPYNKSQLKECYNSVGIEIMTQNEGQYFPSREKNLASKLIKTGGTAICCGWNTIGFGKNLGFELLEILLVCHGGNHNDTICTVERKFTNQLF